MNSLERLKDELKSLPQDSPYIVIEKTAERLEGMNVSPVLLTDVPDFLRLTRNKLIEICEGIISDKAEAVADPQEWKIKQLSLLLYWYQLLIKLRKDDPEAWDEINELYEDD